MKNKLKKLTALCSVALMIFGILNTLSVSAPPLTVIISGIGAMAGDNFGWNVSYAGDLNGDGYDDFIMGAPYNDSEDGSKSECGAVYIFFGYDCITTSNLDALNANVTIYGATAGDHFGWSVSNGGNIDGDGPTVIIGAPDNDTADGSKSSAGAVYIFNKTALNVATKTTLYATNANYTIYGDKAQSLFGFSASYGGNIDGAGYEDIIIGEPGREYFYDNMEYSDSVATGTTTQPFHGWEHYGVGDEWEHGIPSLGDNDVDDDAAGPEGAFSGWYCWGTDLNADYPNDANMKLNSSDINLADAVYPWVSFWHWVDTEAGYDYFNCSVHRTSDDAWLMDVIPKSDFEEEWERKVVNISAVAGQTIYLQFQLTSDASYTRAGWFIDDVRVFEVNGGKAYVIYGDGSIPSSALGADVILSQGRGELFGYSVSYAGDVNNDGKSDILVGCPGYDFHRGAAYLYYGGQLGQATLWIDTFEDGNINGYWSVTTAATGAFTATSAAGEAYTGTYGGKMESAYIRKGVNLRNATSAQISIAWKAAGVDAGEFGYLRVYDGVWSADVARVLDTDTTWKVSTVDLSTFFMCEDFCIRIGDENGNDDFVIFDDVTITRIRSDILIGENFAPGNVGGDNFGYSVKNLSDVNGDGIDDFAIGAPGYGNDKGRVHIYYGSASFSTIGVVSSNPYYYGYKVNAAYWVAQSFNATMDGDLWAVDIAGWDYGAISTYLLYVRINATATETTPSSTTLSSVERAHLPWCRDARESGAWITVIFSTPVPVKKGTKYWIVCNNSQDDPDGYCWMYDNNNPYPAGGFSSNNGAESATDDLVCRVHIKANVTLTGAQQSDKFGYSISSCDVNNDGYNDTTVGAPCNDSATGSLANCGAVYVFSGGSSIPSSISAVDANYVNYGEGSEDQFGFSVAWAGNPYNGARCAILVSAPYNDTPSTTDNKGKVYLLAYRCTLTVEYWADRAADTPTVNQGTTDVLMLNMTLTASDRTITITKIRVNLTGTGSDSNISAVRLMHDVDNDGTLSAGDEQLGEAQFSGGALNFTISFNVVAGTPEKLLILYNISSTATVGNTVGAGLADASYITVKAPDNVSSYNFPIQSTNTQITAVGVLITINEYDLRNATDVSKLNTQIDVNQEYYFYVNITHSEGWTGVDFVNITCWYDNGTETSTYNSTWDGAKNYNFFLQYENTTGTPIFRKLWPDSDEIKLGPTASTETYVTSTTFILKIYFTPGNQTRWAKGGGADGIWDKGEGFDDTYSWNFEINATNVSGAYASKTNETGVFRYTSIVVSQNWIGLNPVEPGGNTDTNPVTINFSSNYDFNLTIWFVNNLTNVSLSAEIPIANNVMIYAVGDISNTYFIGIGESNKIYIYQNKPHFREGVSQSITVTFNVSVPIGTLAGNYVANVSVQVAQG